VNIVFIETFYGGSHKSFLDGLIKYSRHDITPITLPSRFWKWRLRSAALHIAEEYGDALCNCDLIVATDLINLADLKALARFTCPAILFLHENQLTYPTPEGEKPEINFGFVNLVSALAADRCLFNSKYHLGEFDYALKQFINDIPEFVPEQAHQQVITKSQVIYMGIDISEFNQPLVLDNPKPVILWNHRWEFDKQPWVFFNQMYKLVDEGIDFELIILGENFQMHPKEFLEARERLGPRIRQFGFVDSMEDYARFLAMSDIVVSTAIQENFGFAIAEAMYCYSLPLLPKRLSYPEILPEKFHEQFLYHNEEELESKLKWLVHEYRNLNDVRAEIAQAMAAFDWKKRIEEFDALFEEMAKSGRPSSGKIP
jgi:glycosyltransferase involved in cell wall biosynthesis